VGHRINFLRQAQTLGYGNGILVEVQNAYNDVIIARDGVNRALFGEKVTELWEIEWVYADTVKA
jgi:hypothetical protein